MANRNFNEWLSTMKDCINGWKYFTDFKKVYKNVDSIKIELNILNSLIGSKNIENEFRAIAQKYPEVLKVVPLLLAKRESEIIINDETIERVFDFNRLDLTIDDYANFMSKTGLFDLLQNHLIANLVDYVTGVEVGLDSNARKNRTGHSMENLVEMYILKEGLVKDRDYFKEMYKSQIEKKFGLDLSAISNDGKTEKRFDYVIYHNGIVYAMEVNFYSGGGSKLNETARSYKELAIESKDIENFKFVWITDGKGWTSAKHNLEEAFDTTDTIYNLNDLNNGALKALLK